MRQALIASFVALLTSSVIAAPRKSPAEQLDDAELHDVFFVNERLGWAVGDRGVILHTKNGGVEWHQQHSSFACRWRSVHFVDPRHGWIVGGWTKPYSHRTVGVVLKTNDGGEHWVRTRAHVLPALVEVQFVDANRGWACGSASSLYPAGVFHTKDGGHSWSSLPTSSQRHWQTGVFFFNRPKRHPQGIVAGRDGHMGMIQPTGVRAGKLDVGLRTVQAISAQGRHVWLVGDGGLVRMSNDGGMNFGAAATLPSDATQFDFADVAAIGSQSWVVGSPGAQILHTPDAGRTWRWQTTPITTPLRAVHFVSDRVGFAVGSLGTILVTSNGGRNWRIQRQGGARLAMLAVYADSHAVPWEVLAKFAGNRGYLAAVEVIGRRDVETEPTSFAPLSRRLLDATTAVGGSSASLLWQFPLRQPGLLMSKSMVRQGWSATNSTDGERALSHVLVRRLRQWRPSVVVSAMPTPQLNRPADQFVGQALLKAVELAADDKALPTSKAAGLAAWQVKKLYGTEFTTAKRSTASVRVHSKELSLRLGRTLSEHANRARRLVANTFDNPPETTGLHLLVNRLPGSTKSTAIYRDLVLTPGGEARRKRSAPAAARIDSLTRMAQRRRNAYRLMERLHGSSTQQASLLSRFEEMIKGLGPQDAGEMLYQLSANMRLQGDLETAAECLEILLRRYPKHELTHAAAIWLAKFYASAEVAYHLERSRRRSSALTIVGRQENAPGLPETIRPRKVAAVSTRSAPSAQGKRVPTLTNWVQKHSPNLHLEPEFRMPLASLQRRDGLLQKAQGYYVSLASSRINNAWRSAARAEQWLSQRGSQRPKHLWKCRRAKSKPKLDAELQDRVWQNADAVELKSSLRDDQSWPARVKLAYDDQFLYIAIECKKATGFAYQTSSKARPRDADLAQEDRIDLLLDIDRDAGTCYRLTVDHRGWTAESCFGDKKWNPHWYVAAKSDPGTWRVEAAIVLQDLVPQVPGRDAWSIGVQRIVPRVGFQSWSQPSAVIPQIPGFGYLLFR